MSDMHSNPNITPAAIRALIAGSYPGDMGIEPLEITDEHTVGALAVDKRHLHPGKFVHGGAWVGLADSVAAWQTFRHLPDGYTFTTVEMKLNVFKGARDGDHLIATATHMHAGRSTHVVECRVERDNRLVANLIVTQFVIPFSEDAD